MSEFGPAGIAYLLWQLAHKPEIEEKKDSTYFEFFLQTDPRKLPFPILRGAAATLEADQKERRGEARLSMGNTLLFEDKKKKRGEKPITLVDRDTAAQAKMIVAVSLTPLKNYIINQN